MRISGGLLRVVALATSVTSVLAASWTFTDGTVSIQSKGTGVGAGLKEKFTAGKPLQQPITLGTTDTLKIILTAQDDTQAARPNQAALILRSEQSGLDVSYPLSVKENGKAVVSVAYKDLPTQFQRAEISLKASLVLASFGSSAGYNSELFTLKVTNDGNIPASIAEKPLRYGKLAEIHHIFRSEPKSPNVLISTFFTIATLATLPILLGTWLFLGGNINHLSKALNDAPISHAVFLSSIISLEGILFMYYSSWNLFQTLPALTVVGLISFVSGSRALTEVQERRLAGLR